MSNYHVLSASNSGDIIKIAFHIAVPNETNTIGYNIQTALSEDPAFNDEEGIRKLSIVPWIETAEQTQLDNGELYEHVYSFKTNKDIPALTKRDRMDAKYTSLISIVQESIRQRYTYWRFNRDVA